jgi:hypothetical protein
MNGLLANIVEAHGGLARWNSLEKAEATVVGSGGFRAVQLTSVYTEADVPTSRRPRLPTMNQGAMTRCSCNGSDKTWRAKSLISTNWEFPTCSWERGYQTCEAITVSSMAMTPWGIWIFMSARTS